MSGNRTERFHFVMSPDEIRALDDWRFENRIATRASAVRQLIKLGMEAHADASHPDSVGFGVRFYHPGEEN